MPTATLTSKGQITIPAQLREKMHLSPGDQLDFWEDTESALRLTPRVRRLDDFFGVLQTSGPAPSIEEMDEAIGTGATKTVLP